MLPPEATALAAHRACDDQVEPHFLQAQLEVHLVSRRRACREPGVRSDRLPCTDMRPLAAWLCSIRLRSECPHGMRDRSLVVSYLARPVRVDGASHLRQTCRAFTTRATPSSASGRKFLAKALSRISLGLARRATSRRDRHPCAGFP